MIHLNDPRYNIKEYPSENGILKYVSDYDILKYYYPNLKLNTVTLSPLRKDSKPSFSVYMSPKIGKLIFNDFGTNDKGGVFIFLMKYFNLPLARVYEQVVVDFNLEHIFLVNDLNIIKGKKPKTTSKEKLDSLVKESTDIKITVRSWNKEDLEYWNTYGICKETLDKYRVLPISYLFINKNVHKVDPLSYAYVEFKDGITRYKIYQPKSDKIKWINNLVEGTLSGWEQMPATGEYLIIASSLKDAMCLHDIGLTSVLAPQTENYTFKAHIVNALKKRFKTIYVFYDNDEPGINASNKMNKLYDFKILLTDSKDCKDPSDYCKMYGKKKLIECILKQLYDRNTIS